MEMEELLLVLVGVLFSIICHGVTKRIIIASILSSFLSCMAIIIVLGSVDTGGTLRSALLVVGLPIYFFISVIIGLFYRGLRYKIDKTTKAINGDSPKKAKRIGRFIFKLAFNIGVFFILLVVIGNLGNVMENNIDASKKDRKANMDIKNAYTASQAYFTDYPDAAVSLSKLTSYGFVQSSDVILTVISGSQKNLQLTAAHAKGSKTHTINSGGEIYFIDGKRDVTKSFKATKQFPSTKAPSQEETLISAALSNNISTVKKLRTEGININAKNKKGETALITASLKGHTEIVSTLLEYGADVNVKDNNGYTPLYAASSGGHKDLVELLIAHGADINVKDKNGWTPLIRAVFWGNREIVEFLIAHGAYVNVKDKNGATPMHFAAFNRKVKITELLIAKGADVNGKDINGLTPLHNAALKNQTKIAELLIAKGADVNAKDNIKAATPLGLAIQEGQNEVAELLREHGGK